MKCIRLSMMVVAVSLGATAMVFSSSGTQTPNIPAFSPRKVLPKPLPPITRVPTTAASRARAEIVTGNELVLGVVVAGQARAYPINQLTGPHREIINDRLAGKPITATW